MKEQIIHLSQAPVYCVQCEDKETKLAGMIEGVFYCIPHYYELIVQKNEKKA